MVEKGRLLPTAECLVLIVQCAKWEWVGLEKSFFNHPRKDWFRQKSSMDARCRGKYFMRSKIFAIVTIQWRNWTSWPGDQNYHHQCRTGRHQVLLNVMISERVNITYIVSWPGMHNLNLIMRKNHSVPHFGFIKKKKKAVGEDCFLQKDKCQLRVQK